MALEKVAGSIPAGHPPQGTCAADAALLAVRKLRRHRAPHDIDFPMWAGRIAGAETAEVLSRAAVVFTFDHDPGRLSATFVRERGARVLGFPPAARYVVGG